MIIVSRCPVLRPAAPPKILIKGPTGRRALLARPIGGIHEVNCREVKKNPISPQTALFGTLRVD